MPIGWIIFILVVVVFTLLYIFMYSKVGSSKKKLLRGKRCRGWVVSAVYDCDLQSHKYTIELGDSSRWFSYHEKILSIYESVTVIYKDNECYIV